MQTDLEPSTEQGALSRGGACAPHPAAMPPCLPQRASLAGRIVSRRGTRVTPMSPPETCATSLLPSGLRAGMGVGKRAGAPFLAWRSRLLLVQGSQDPRLPRSCSTGSPSRSVSGPPLGSGLQDLFSHRERRVGLEGDRRGPASWPPRPPGVRRGPPGAERRDPSGRGRLRAWPRGSCHPCGPAGAGFAGQGELGMRPQDP